jgi:hypothetical protein
MIAAARGRSLVETSAETKLREVDRGARPKRSEERAEARDVRASDVRPKAPAQRWSQATFQ